MRCSLSREDRVLAYVLAIDRGTTSTRAILFRADTSIASFAQPEFPQHSPADGEVEHEPQDADWGESGGADRILRVDGGMAASDWTMQRLADSTGNIVDRPRIGETTALGAAYLAGLQAGFFPEPDRFDRLWRRHKRSPHGARHARAETQALDFGGAPLVGVT
jgi:glycerol kinase